MNHDSRSSARLAPVTARGQATRLRILRSAETVFGQKGYDGASIAEICRLADTALGSFYVYFPDKKAAFVELVDSLGARLRAELATAVVGLSDRLLVERAGLRAFFAFAAQHRRLYRIVGQAEFVDEAVFRRYHERLAEGYIRGLRHAMAAGQIRQGDAEVLAYALMGMADFLGMRWVLWEDSADIEHVVDAALDLLHSGIAQVGAGAVQSSPKIVTKVVKVAPAKKSVSLGERRARR
jgi:AcrR family transcriptional regulator